MRAATTPTWAVVACGLLAVARCELNVATEWQKTELRLRANETGGAEYVPDNNLAYRLRVWADTAYVAVPRFRPGVPATLCATPVRGGPLRPYPSAGLQTRGNCVGLQNAVDIELDHLGRLWTLDRGRPEENGDESEENGRCDPKLFVVDTGTGRAVRSAVMPPHVFAADGGSVLSGLAVDLKTLTAVVADVGAGDPGFVTYDYRSGVYRKFRCAALARPDDGHREAVLAASPIDDQLYFTAVGLPAVYAIPLSVFAAPPLYGRDVGHYATARGPLDGTTVVTAAVMDAAGTLYVAVRPGHKVVAWDTLRRGFDAAAGPAVLEPRLDWVSGLALDARGYMWIVTSAYREFARAGAAADARLFRRYSGVTAFALQEAAANLTAAEGDGNAHRDTAATAVAAAAAAAATAVPARTAAVVLGCAAAAALLRIAWKT